MQGGGAAGYVFHQLTLDHRVVAHCRTRPDVVWLGDSMLLLRGAFDVTDRMWLDGDVAEGHERPAGRVSALG